MTITSLNFQVPEYQPKPKKEIDQIIETGEDINMKTLTLESLAKHKEILVESISKKVKSLENIREAQRRTNSPNTIHLVLHEPEKAKQMRIESLIEINERLNNPTQIKVRKYTRKSA